MFYNKLSALLLFPVFCGGGILLAADAPFYGSKTQVYDSAAEGFVDRSVVAADGLLGWPPEKENQYYAEMDNFGPDVILILIKRYDSIKNYEVNSYLEKLLLLAIADAVVRYDGSSTQPLGTERRREALKFLAGLLKPRQEYNISAFALIALQRCAAKVNITEPFVVEAVCQVLARAGRSPIRSLRYRVGNYRRDRSR